MTGLPLHIIDTVAPYRGRSDTVKVIRYSRKRHKPYYYEYSPALEPYKIGYHAHNYIHRSAEDKHTLHSAYFPREPGRDEHHQSPRKPYKYAVKEFNRHTVHLKTQYVDGYHVFEEVHVLHGEGEVT